MFVLVNHHTQCTLTFSQNASKAVCARTGTAFGAKAVVAASGRSKAAANLMVGLFFLDVACQIDQVINFHEDLLPAPDPGTGLGTCAEGTTRYV